MADLIDLSIKKKNLSTHHVCVRGAAFRDTKMFSVDGKGKAREEIYDIIRTYCLDDMIPKYKDSIEMVGDRDRKRRTHSIVVFDTQSMKSNSFTIKFPRYSSVEVARYIYSHICGGRQSPF